MISGWQAPWGMSPAAQERGGGVGGCGGRSSGVVVARGFVGLYSVNCVRQEKGAKRSRLAKSMGYVTCNLGAYGVSQK